MFFFYNICIYRIVVWCGAYNNVKYFTNCIKYNSKKFNRYSLTLQLLNLKILLTHNKIIHFRITLLLYNDLKKDFTQTSSFTRKHYTKSGKVTVTKTFHKIPNELKIQTKKLLKVKKLCAIIASNIKTLFPL